MREWSRAEAMSHDDLTEDPGESVRTHDTLVWLTRGEGAAPSEGIGPQPVQGDALPRLSAQLELRGELGRGGMGKVTLAVQRSLRREVAIKSVHAATPEAAAALVREAVFAGYLEHPNVVPVHELGQDEGERPLMVMKRVVGDPWQALLADPGHPRWAKLGQDRVRASVEVLRQVCNAVQFAHSRGIVHRDIKPANVMLGDFGEVYLLDWGLALRLDARDPQSTQLVGTPGYMAPEMVDGEEGVSERTDVYLLGATLHHALTGRRRHEASTTMGVLSKALSSDPVAYGPTVPAELGELCNRATACDPAQRPASALAFKEALEAFLSHRAAHELCQEAGTRLSQLRAQLASASPDRRMVTAMVAECRFGYRQALREWPASPEATAGLQECLELVAAHELANGNLELAEAWLAELPQPREELAARASALRRTREAEQARLRELDRQHDLSVSRAQRTAFVAAGGVFAVLLLLGVAVVMRRGVHFTHRSGIALSLSVIAFLSLGLFFGRRALLISSINRRSVGTAYALAFLPLLVQLQGWLAGFTVEATALGLLLGLGAAFTTAGAALGARELAVTGLLLLVGAFVCAAVQALAPDYLLVALNCSLVVPFAGGWLARITRRR